MEEKPKRGGQGPKRIGYRAEKRIEARLAPFGFRRQIMSGALGGEHAGDLRRRGLGKAVFVIEVKRRKQAMTLLRRWLRQGEAHALVVVPIGKEEPLVVMELQTVQKLMGEGGYHAEAGSLTTLEDLLP